MKDSLSRPPDAQQEFLQVSFLFWMLQCCSPTKHQEYFLVIWLYWASFWSKVIVRLKKKRIHVTVQAAITVADFGASVSLCGTPFLISSIHANEERRCLLTILSSTQRLLASARIFTNSYLSSITIETFSSCFLDFPVRSPSLWLIFPERNFRNQISHNGHVQ